MPLIDTRKLEPRQPKPGWHGRLFASESMTFAYYTIDPGASLHEHAHPNEEVWHVLSGELEITIGSDTLRAVAGSAALVPPNTAHSVRALATSTVLVVDEGRRLEIGGGARAALSVELLDVTGGLLDLEVRNRGREPGFVRRLEIATGREPALPAALRTQIASLGLDERTEVAGGGSLRRTHAVADAKPAWVRGVLVYEDARGALHHTTFCRVRDAEQRLVPPTLPGYNYGD